MARVRLIDVAERAGVSLATASRVLNESKRNPAQEYVDRVRAAAAELGYVVNAQAQALARAKTGLLGLIVQDISDPYFSSIAAGAEEVAREHGMQLLLASTHREPRAECEAVTAFSAHRADAVVVVGTRWTRDDDHALAKALRQFERTGGRVVLIGQPLEVEQPLDDAAVVRPPNIEGARTLAEVLLAAGHRRFAVVTGPDTVATARERADAFTEAIDAGGGTVVAVVRREFSRDGGYEAAEAISNLFTAVQPCEPLCVFAASDVMAIGLIAGLRRLGVGVPEDVQVAGFDDIPTLRDHLPELTTVRVPLVDMGRQAVLAALSDDVPTIDPLQAQVIERESTRRPSRDH